VDITASPDVEVPHSSDKGMVAVEGKDDFVCCRIALSRKKN